MTAAVEQAYKDVLSPGKYGFVILNIQIDPSKVDCNVHPAKLEVRFAEEQNVFKAVYHAIKSKNENIILKTHVQSEIENQNKFEEVEEIKKEEKEEKIFEEDDAKEINNKFSKGYKPREGTFSGFFKIFRNNKNEEDDEDKENAIKEIFETKKSAGLNWGSFNVSKEEEKIDDVKEDKNDIEKEIEEEIEREEENNNQNVEEIEKEVETLKEKAARILNKVDKIEENENSKCEVKLGNTIISSDTRESGFSINDLLNKEEKFETVKIDIKERLSSNASKTEIIENLKNVDEEKKIEEITENSNDVVEDNSKELNNDEKDREISERLLEQKENNSMEDTQFIDTGKVRDTLRNNKVEEEIPITKDFANMYKKVFGMDVSTIRKTKAEENAKLDFSSNIQIADTFENQSVFDKTQEVPDIKYRFVGTIFDTYAIIEVKDEVYMIEKEAAEERLMYDIVRRSYYDNNYDDSVTLLLADVISLNSKEFSMARELSDMFKKVGFEYDEFGDCTLKLVKVPSWSESFNTKKLFLEILREMNTVAVTATTEKEDKFIWAVSNKYVTFADTSLTENELEDLIKRLLLLPSPFIYPNGKLIAVKITKANMERKFSRR